MHRTNPPRRLLGVIAVLFGFLLFAAACGDDDTSSTAAGEDVGTDDGGGDTTDGGGEEVTLRLGYFPNVTHAPAVYGVEEGLFEEALGDSVTLQSETFSTGTEASEAFLADAIDATFIGPNPAINGFAQSEGEALRIVSGSTSGGAALVVSEDITTPEDLAGTQLATPSLGNTQDVALRAWLKEEGYETDTSGGGDVMIVPQENADTLTAFQAGEIDGAWVPEPWATRLVLEGEGHVLVNEADLWPDGEFVTTHLIVSTSFLDEHPDVIKGLITGLLDSIDEVNADSDAAKEVVNAGIEKITTSALAPETIGGAFESLTFTADPIASSLQKSADDAISVDLLEPVELDGIYDLTILNEVLEERGDDPVEGF